MAGVFEVAGTTIDLCNLPEVLKAEGFLVEQAQ